MSESGDRESAGQSEHSYKFQRLREKIRLAITNGELTGKLPGERALARQFHVNAKTLSKALTDLAAEGILDRSIGRGTYIKGQAPAPVSGRRWLIVCDPNQLQSEVIRLISAARPDTEVATELTSVRPSFLNQFNAVIDLSSQTPDSFIRDLVVRNVPVVVVGKEPRTYSTHAVQFDCVLAVSQLGRDLLLGGHRKLAAVEPGQCTLVADTLRNAAIRYSPGASVDGCFPGDVASMIDSGVTAFLCHSPELADEVQQQLQRLKVAVPQQVSLGAVGGITGEAPVSGYFAHCSEKAQAILRILAEAHSRPTAIWLAGQYVDRGTLAPMGAATPPVTSEGSSQTTL